MGCFLNPSAFSPNEARNYRRQWEILCQELTALTGLSHQLVEMAGKEGSADEPWLLPAISANYLGRQMIFICLPGMVGGAHYRHQHLAGQWAYCHRFLSPLLGATSAQHVFNQNPRHSIFCLHLGVTGEIAKDDAKLDEIARTSNSWLDNCLRDASDELLQDRMPIHRAERDKQLFGLYQPDGGELWAGIYHYLAWFSKPWPGRGGFRQSRLQLPV